MVRNENYIIEILIYATNVNFISFKRQVLLSQRILPSVLYLVQFYEGTLNIKSFFLQIVWMAISRPSCVEHPLVTGYHYVSSFYDFVYSLMPLCSSWVLFTVRFVFWVVFNCQRYEKGAKIAWSCHIAIYDRPITSKFHMLKIIVLTRYWTGVVVVLHTSYKPTCLMSEQIIITAIS